MLGLGTTELLIISFVIILLFGAKRLPQLGRSMGSALTNFKKGLKEGEENKEKIEEKDS